MQSGCRVDAIIHLLVSATRYHYLYRNDYRQHAVNAKAVANHAGIGTAATYGVPGSASGIHGHKSGYHNYGHDHKSGYNHKSGYGYPGYLHHPVYFYGR